MRFAIDGTTGLLGRNLLFEILKQNLKALDKIEILILGKGANGLTLEQRMNAIIYEDGFNYLAQDRNSDLFTQIKSRINYIDFDLTKSDLGITDIGLKILKNGKIDYYFHNAALSSFFDTPEITKQLNIINFDGTKNILNLVKSLKVNEFIYVSSAYHAGALQNEILPNRVNNTDAFRNPYERTKLRTELYLKDFANNHKIQFKIFRTTTIAGRLIENEIGAINKFDVFYGWGLFFLKYKIKLFKNIQNIYSEPLETKLRIKINQFNLMNIIPADYGAKLLLIASFQDDIDQNFHLVNNADYATINVINKIMENLNIAGHTFVDDEPDDKTQFEQLYYKSVGKIFTPYIVDPPLHYNNDNLKPIIKNYGLECPEMNETNFQKLMDYAKKHNFGI